MQLINVSLSLRPLPFDQETAVLPFASAQPARMLRPAEGPAFGARRQRAAWRAAAARRGNAGRLTVKRNLSIGALRGMQLAAPAQGPRRRRHPH
jgi:hypothetical protein